MSGRLCTVAIVLVTAMTGLAAGQCLEERQELTPSTGPSLDFGDAMDVSGDVALIGQWCTDVAGVNCAGSVFVFGHDGTSWVEEQMLTANDPSDTAFFGRAVALDGDLAVIGAWGDGTVSLNAGSAYVFRHDGTTWVEEQKLTASDGMNGDIFGHAVAVAGDVIVVGAGGDDVGASTDAGSAYVFGHDGISWVETQKLTASIVDAGAGFGRAVDADEEVILVGAPSDSSVGAAYTFRWDGAAWVEEQKLTSGSVSSSSRLGTSVALQGDRILVAASKDDDVASGAGSVLYYRWDGTAWLEEQKLTASDAVLGDEFGLDLGLDGDLTVVAADDDLYAYRFDGTSWTNEQLLAGPSSPKSAAVAGTTAFLGEADRVFVYETVVPDVSNKITAVDGQFADDFGISISLSGDVMAVGAWGDDDAAPGAGALYVFRDDGAAWQEEQKLTASDAAAQDGFGLAAEVSGDTILVGAGENDEAGTDAGAAYVFELVGTQWVETQKITAGDTIADDRFGFDVSLSGDVALIGAGLHDDAGSQAGAAYVFRRRGTTWVEEQKLTASDALTNDRFGVAVSVWENLAVVGALQGDGAVPDSGAAYVFRHDGSEWVEEAKLTASDGASADWFGQCVAIEGDVAVVGAPLHSVPGFSGAAFVYRFDGNAWAEEQKLIADGFGWSVAVREGRILVGATGNGDGSASLFRYDGTAWVEDQEFTAGDHALNDAFGAGLWVGADRAVVGATGSGDGFLNCPCTTVCNTGAVYTFGLSEILLRVEPETAGAGTPMTIVTYSGKPTHPAMLFLAAVNGQPFFSSVAVGMFDAKGVWQLSAPVPDDPNLPENSLTLRTFAIGWGGNIVQSNDQTVTFQ